MLHIIKKMSSMSQGNLKKDSIKKPIVVVTFDDGSMSESTIAYPYMSARGVKGTSYVVGDLIGNTSQDRMGWNEIHDLINSGMWDIQDHTFYHELLTQSTPERIEESLTLMDNLFISQGLEPPKHIAYPQGLYDRTAMNVIDPYRLTGVGTGNINLNDYENFDFLQIRRSNADAQTHEKVQAIKDNIDLCIQENKILVIYMHRIFPEINSAPSSVAQAYFEEMIDHIAEAQEQSKITSMTISEMYDYVSLYQEKEEGIVYVS